MNQNTDEKVIRKRRIITNIALIVISIVTAALTTMISLKAIVRRDRQITTELVSAVLDTTVENEFEKPLHVAETMAGDIFLEDFVKQEETMPAEEFSAMMGRYLTQIRNSNEWESVYFSSAKTMRYYTVNGFEKVIAPASNTYDRWYSNFIDSGRDYLVDMQIDQFNQDVETIFVNKRMYDSTGSLMGVCTVGVRVNVIQETIKALEDQYRINVYFTDETGKVELSSGASSSTDFVLRMPKAEAQTAKYTYEENDGFIAARYLPQLGWYLAIQNTQNMYTHSIARTLYLVFGVMMLLILGNLLLNMLTTTNSEYHLNTKADTNTVTGLLNRPAVAARATKYMSQKQGEVEGGTLFLIDIDHLKDVKDTFGQKKADEIQMQIAKAIVHAFRSDDLVGEISSYEYVVFCLGALNEETILRKCAMVLRDSQMDISENGKKIHITASIGIALYPRHGGDFYQLCHSAAEPLRHVRDNGGNGYEMYDETVYMEDVGMEAEAEAEAEVPNETQSSETSVS